MCRAEFLRKALMAECYSFVESDPQSQHWYRIPIRHFPHIFGDYFICLRPRFCYCCGRLNLWLSQSDLVSHRATYPQTGWYTMHGWSFLYAPKGAAFVMMHLVTTAFLSCRNQENRSVTFLWFSSWDTPDRNVAEVKHLMHEVKRDIAVVEIVVNSKQHCTLNSSIFLSNVKAMRKNVA